MNCVWSVPCNIVRAEVVGLVDADAKSASMLIASRLRIMAWDNSFILVWDGSLDVRQFAALSKGHAKSRLKLALGPLWYW